jgi:hypothetical protein
MLRAEEARKLVRSPSQVHKHQLEELLTDIEDHIREQSDRGFYSYTLVIPTRQLLNDIGKELTAAGYVYTHSKVRSNVAGDFAIQMRIIWHKLE